MTKLDILAFGAHPDDVEIGMGGTIALYSKRGFNIGVCNLTLAELSSNGTVETRQREASAASDILGVKKRIQLELPDRGLTFYTADQLQQIVSIIRMYKPKLVFAPFHIDRHPDHGMTTSIIKEAIFNSGIRNYRCESKLPAHRIEAYYLYMINAYERPDFIVDISLEIETKKRALAAFKSQFDKSDQSVETPLTNGYIEKVVARERLFGSEAGVGFAEGFKTTKPILVENLLEMREE
ncbi:bacillithiol biosynthesis deacetylase BshB1 [Alkalihalophilus sp. As8PL]|uniref:Bacillithiol biosynthesis deacetylase BshB1 n=1 Tax=Alkalihalophilus sp. As8PL TaxID=3237103 RepID=A0AB39BUL0_9BACI